jgi:hypothetical protein
MPAAYLWIYKVPRISHCGAQMRIANFTVSFRVWRQFRKRSKRSANIGFSKALRIDRDAAAC